MTSLCESIDDLAGCDDFSVQVFGKFAEVDDFDNFADFDDFTVRVDLADFDDWMSKLADRIKYSALQPDLRIPPTSVPV